MEYRKLGRTDLKVSAICLGTMTFGEQNTEADGHSQLDYAFDQGVNFIDTAEIYSIPPRAETKGSTERIIGSWLAARKNRDKVILATKVCGRGDINWMRDKGEATCLDARNITFADRGLAEAAADRLYRPLPAALAGPRHAAVRRRRNRLQQAGAAAGDPDRGDAGGARRPREGRQDSPCRPLQRDGLGRVAFSAGERDARGSAHRLDSERLSSSQPHLRNRSRGIRHARSRSDCSPIRRWRRAI